MSITRRSLLRSAGSLAAGLTITDPLMNMFAETPAANKLKIIVAGGHPGDPEYGCGGTIARLTRLGHEVVLLYLNDGAWPPTPSNVRVAEAKRACEILGSRPA